MSQFNTIAGWALAGGIVALGSSIVAAEYWHVERPEQMGYVVEGVVEEGGGAEAEMSIEAALNQATVAQGETLFARCASCHTVNQGGANGIGPNLYGIVGDSIAEGRGGYDFSSALSGVGGTWTFDQLSQWLHRPSTFAAGTKMSFAGLSDPLDRAAVILYLNANGSNLPLPPPPAEAPAAADESAAGDEATTDAETAVPEAATEAAPAPGA